MSNPNPMYTVIITIRKTDGQGNELPLHDPIKMSGGDFENYNDARSRVYMLSDHSDELDEIAAEHDEDNEPPFPPKVISVLVDPK